MDVPDNASDPDSAPIPDDSYVLRRVHKNDVDTSQPVPMLPHAFRPSSEDSDGLSVYQDDHHGGPTPIAVAASGGGGADSYLIVRLLVGDLRKLGLE